MLAKRLLISICVVLGLSAAVFALSQNVTYKPWGVPDSRRAEYEAKLDEIDRTAQLDAIPTALVIPRAVDHDFKWVTSDAVSQHEFQIINRGDRELELTILDSTCDCLVAKLESDRVAPGETTQCQIEWTVPQGETLDTNADLFIATNDPRTPKIRYSCKGMRRQVIVGPQSIQLDKNDLDEPANKSFFVFSQLHDHVTIESVTADGYDVEWSSEPAEMTEAQLVNHSATSAAVLNVNLSPHDFGRFEGVLQIAAQTSAGEHQLTVPFSGKVRPPIGFYGPDIHKDTGLDMGTLDGGKRTDFFVSVRSRVDQERNIEVLQTVPDALETELTSTAQPGVFRLRITVPKGCPDLQFNLPQNRGFVKVGDPKSETYSSWLPIWVSVSNIK